MLLAENRISAEEILDHVAHQTYLEREMSSNDTVSDSQMSNVRTSLCMHARVFSVCVCEGVKM